MNRLHKIVVVLAGALLAMLLHVAPAAADPISTPSSDPDSADYNPWAWHKQWGLPASPAPTGDLNARLSALGLVSSTHPEQYEALTADDVSALNAAWDSGLLGKTVGRSTTWASLAIGSPSDPHLWTQSDSDSVASDLGAANYAALSPGLKSVVQRVAMIVAGQNKPVMPDDAWSSWMPADLKAAYDASEFQRIDWSKLDFTGDPTVKKPDTDCGLNIQCNVIKGSVNAAGTTAEAISFVSDPFGWIGAKMAAGAAGMWGWIAGLANSGTAPDLSTDWWIDAYQKAMAVGIVLALVVLLYQFVQLSAGKISGRDLLESIILWTPAYLAGIVFGPALGQFFVHGSVALTDGIVQSFSGFSASETDTQMKAAFEAAGSGKAIGGIFVGIFVLIFAVIGSIVLFCSLALQLIAIYLSSALFAVGFAWVVSVRHRGGSYKIPFLFLALLFARPTLFFLLGIGLAAMNKALSFSDEGAQNLANLLFGVGVMLLAAFAPFLLLKHAPVSPAGWQAPGGGGGGGAAAAGAAAGGTALMRLANRNAARPSPAPSARGGSAAGGSAGGGAVSAAGGAVAVTGGGGGAPGAGRVAGSVSGGARRGAALMGGPPSAAGWRLASATGQPMPAGVAPAGAAGAAGKPPGPASVGSAGAGPGPSRPGGAAAPGAARSTTAAAAPSGAGSGDGAVVGRSSSQGAARSGSSRSSRVAGAARRAGRSGAMSPRGLVEGADGDQRWDSLR